MKKRCVIVKSALETYKVDVDDFFDDPYMEACTRMVEYKRKCEEGLSLPPFMIASLHRKGAKEKVYNSYIVLANCGLYQQAENLRIVFQKDSGVDLKDEPFCSK